LQNTANELLTSVNDPKFTYSKVSWGRNQWFCFSVPSNRWKFLYYCVFFENIWHLRLPRWCCPKDWSDVSELRGPFEK
jgi:hypothetical protein